MAKYQVETDQGTFEVETDEPGAEPSLGSKIASGVNDFGSGAMEGASFDTATINKSGNVVSKPKEESVTPGSIMTATGKAKPDFTSKYSGIKGAGKLAGSIIPMIVAEITAGAPAEALALKYGMGPVQAAMNSTGMTMGAYEGMRGVAENKPAIETVGKMATGYVAGMPLGAAGHYAEKGMEYLTKDVPTGIANQYLKPSKKTAESLTDKGKPDLGESFLSDTKYNSSKSKKGVYDDIRRRLEENRMVIREKLARADEVARTPSVNGPDTPGPQKLLEHKPVAVETRTPGAAPWPGMRDVRNSPGSAVWPSGLKSSDPELVVLPKSDVETFDPHGTYYQSDPTSPRLGKGVHFGGTPNEITPTPEQAGENMSYKDLFKATVKAKGEGYPFNSAGIKKGPYIDLDEVRKAAEPISTEQSDIGANAAANSIEKIMGESGVAAGEHAVTNSRAYELLTRLDAQVNKAYQAVDKNTIPPETEAWAAMANKLRDMLRQNVPEASELLGRNHKLQLYEASLLPQVAGRAPIGGGSGVVKQTIAKAVGSRAGLAVARGLESIAKPGTLSNLISENIAKPAVRTGSKLGLAEYITSREKSNVKR